MTATNHVLTGAVIAASIHNPFIALPAAFASHFALDAVPHFDFANVTLTSRTFRTFLSGDIMVALACLLAFIWIQPSYVWLIVAGGVLASSPDLMWLPDFVLAQMHRKKPVYGPIRRFHSYIQWWTGPYGIFVEALWAVMMVVLLSKILVT